MIKTDDFPEGKEVVMCEAKLEYTQECDEVSDDYQRLEISTGSQGGGMYFVIKTERWAFDDIDDLIAVLNDFKEKTKIVC